MNAYILTFRRLTLVRKVQWCELEWAEKYLIKRSSSLVSWDSHTHSVSPDGLPMEICYRQCVGISVCPVTYVRENSTHSEKTLIFQMLPFKAYSLYHAYRHYIHVVNVSYALNVVFTSWYEIHLTNSPDIAPFIVISFANGGLDEVCVGGDSCFFKVINISSVTHWTSK